MIFPSEPLIWYHFNKCSNDLIHQKSKVREKVQKLKTDMCIRTLVINHLMMPHIYLVTLWRGLASKMRTTGLSVITCNGVFLHCCTGTLTEGKDLNISPGTDNMFAYNWTKSLQHSHVVWFQEVKLFEVSADWGWFLPPCTLLSHRTHMSPLLQAPKKAKKEGGRRHRCRQYVWVKPDLRVQRG